MVADKNCKGQLCTYWSDNQVNVSSQIDHIVVANDHKFIVKNCTVYDDTSLNSSDHVPISCNIYTNLPCYPQSSRTRYNWSKGDLHKLINNVFISS